MGGLYGASKWHSLKFLQEANRPNTLLVQLGKPMDAIVEEMNRDGLSYPVVVKPDYGERGKGVELVHNQAQLQRAVDSHKTDFLIQEYLDMPVEAGLFYIRYPWEEKGRLTSIVVKGFLTVTGDGHHNIDELALRNKRAVVIWNRLRPSLEMDLKRVPLQGEEVVLEPIGNHSRGTAFNDGNFLINSQLEKAVQALADQHPGFYYGRFDVRVPDMDSLQRGEHIKVMEVNGANAEPAHIYQEGASLVKGLFTLVSYWQIIFRISKFNQKSHSKVKFKDALFFYQQWTSAKQTKWNA